MLKRRGVERVRPLAGGLDAWRSHGLPLETEDGGPEPASIEARAMPDPGALGECVVLDPEGQPVGLADLWKDRPVVLVFVRHFGCILCRELAVELREHAEELREAGGEVVIIGNGQPDSAGRFREEFDLDFPVLVDPQRHIYEQLGLRRNLGGSAHPAVLLRAFRAWWRGFRQGRTQGDPWQLGGVLIVRPDGEIGYRHQSRFAGDHPAIGDLVRALRGAP